MCVRVVFNVSATVTPSPNVGLAYIRFEWVVMFLCTFVLHLSLTRS